MYYRLLGLLLMVGGLSLNLLQQRSYDLGDAIILGGLLAFFAGYLVQFRPRALGLNSAADYDSVGHLVNAWARFERALDGSERLPLSRKLANAHRSGWLEQAELAEVRDLLGVRNDVVHQGVLPSARDLDAAARRLQDLTASVQVRRQLPEDAP